MIRLFTALALPDDLRARIAGMEAGIDGARWVPAENLHITLRFIGEVPEDRVDDIVAALDDVRGRAVTVSPGSAGHFGSGRKLRSIWVGIAPSPELATLHDKIDHALVRCGLPPEGRKYAPHITVARLGGARTNHVLKWLEANGDFFAVPFEAHGFVLYESRPGSGGPAYLPLAEFPLS